MLPRTVDQQSIDLVLRFRPRFLAVSEPVVAFHRDRIERSLDNGHDLGEASSSTAFRARAA